MTKFLWINVCITLALVCLPVSAQTTDEGSVELLGAVSDLRANGTDFSIGGDERYTLTSQTRILSAANGHTLPATALVDGVAVGVIIGSGRLLRINVYEGGLPE